MVRPGRPHGGGRLDESYGFAGENALLLFHRNRDTTLDQLREVYLLRAEAEDNGVLIGLEPIRCDLETASGCGGDLLSERYRVAFGATAQVPREYQLAIAFDCDERPSVSDSSFLFTLPRLGLFLHPDVSPKLVALDIPYAETVDALREESVALLTCQRQEIQNRSRVHLGNPRSAVNRATLDQVLQDAHGLLLGQDHVAEWPLMRLGESLAALLAAIALQTIAVFAKFLRWLIAGWAVHFVSSLEQRKSIKDSKHCQEKSSFQNDFFSTSLKIASLGPEVSYVEGLAPEENQSEGNLTVGIGVVCESGDCVIVASDVRVTYRGMGSDPHDWSGKQYPFPPFNLVATIAGNTSSTHAVVSEFSAELRKLILAKQADNQFQIEFEHIRNSLERARKKELRRLQACAMDSQLGVSIEDWIAGKLPTGDSFNQYALREGLRILKGVADEMEHRVGIIVAGFNRGKPVLIRGLGARPAEDGPSPAIFVIGGKGAHEAHKVLTKRDQSIEMGIARSLFHVCEAMEVARKDKGVGKPSDYTVMRPYGLSGLTGILRVKWNHPQLKAWRKKYKNRSTNGLEKEFANDLIREALFIGRHKKSEWLGPKELSELL